MNEEQFILLAVKVLSGNHLPEEPEELRKQMVAHEPYRVIYEKLSVYWKADTHLKINEDAALDKVWGRIGQSAGEGIEPAREITTGVTGGAPEFPGAKDFAGNVSGTAGSGSDHYDEALAGYGQDAAGGAPYTAAEIQSADADVRPADADIRPATADTRSATADTRSGDDDMLSTADATPVRKIRWKQWLAAAALIPLLVISVWYLMRPSSKMELVEKYNQKGIRSIIILPDGSKIWLNADSRLKYPAAFQDSLREVYLEGEAFFEIAKNPQRPFVVRLPKGNVHVLGTSFDIRAYEEEESMATSVATGRVAFVPIGARYTMAGSTNSVNDQPLNSTVAGGIELTANRKAVYDFQTGNVQVKPTDAEADRGWINGIITFNNESLGHIAVELERSFGKPIKFSHASIAQYRYTATFKNNTEEEILSTLRKVKTFHFTVTDKFIEINK